MLIFTPFTGLIKNYCLNKSKFSSGFASFKYGKKNKISEYFSARFWSLLCLKRKVLYEFPPKCFKITERHSLAVCGSLFGEKLFLLIFIPLYWFDQKQLLKQIKFFSVVATFQHGTKNKNFEYISASLLCLKRKVLYEFLPKCFKTTERHSLAVCG